MNQSGFHGIFCKDSCEPLLRCFPNQLFLDFFWWGKGINKPYVYPPKALKV